jgi:outer membrane lipoprotein-sorting protein
LSNNLPDDLLDKAIASLRDSAPATGPTPDAIERTLARIQAAQATHAAHALNWRILMKPRFSLAAAAMIAVALLGALWVHFAGPGNVALGEVIAKVNAIHSVSFKSVTTVHMPDIPEQPVNLDVTIAEPMRLRQVVEATGTITIWDCQGQKSLTLDPVNKTATIMNAKDFQKVGEQEIDKHPAVGFKTVDPMGTQKTIWVDKQTQLPMRVEMETKGGILGTQSTVFSDFHWDVPIDEQQFSLTPPADYQVINLNMDLSSITENDAIASLRMMAELNDNTFPDRFDVAGLAQVVARSAARLAAENRGDELAAKQQEMMQKSVQISRAWMFISDRKYGTDFHYAGKGVQLDQPGTPILWYKPAGAESYRVLDADLTVRVVPANDLPKVESILLNPLPSTQPASH